MKYSQPLAKRYKKKKKKSPPQKKYLWVGGVYTMENNDINTDYHKFVTVGEQKKNRPHLKCQFPPKIPIWPMSLLYKCSEKWLSRPPPPPSPKGRGGGWMVQTMCPHPLWSKSVRKIFSMHLKQVMHGNGSTMEIAKGPFI